jgi:class 3 adenylate cyclase
MRTGSGYKGMGVHEAARIAAQGQGGEIVVSTETLIGGPSRYRLSEAREISLKGVSQPVEVVSVDWS